MATIRFNFSDIKAGVNMSAYTLLPLGGTVDRIFGTDSVRSITLARDSWLPTGLNYDGSFFSGSCTRLGFVDSGKLRMLVDDIPQFSAVLNQIDINHDVAEAYKLFLISSDTIIGSAYRDKLEGGRGNDTIRGADGNDVLSGEEGLDSLTGGYGRDHFYFQKSMASTNRDVITDFKAADDTLFFDNDGFAGLGAAGGLTESRFRAGTRALDASDRIIYNDATGRVYYDRDGSGAAAAVLIAEVGANKHLTLADFWVAD